MQSRGHAGPPGAAAYLVINGGRHEGASFAGRRLVKFTPVAATFIGCDFSGLDVDDMSFGGGAAATEYRDCVFDNANLRMGAVGLARFTACSFRDVAIRRLECSAVDLVDCTFSGSIRGGFIRAKPLAHYRHLVGRERNVVTGNDFSGAWLTDFHFEQGVDLTRQHLPQSDDYLYLPDGPTAAAAASEVLTTCPAELRRFAELTVEAVEDLASGGQQQIWLRKKELFPKHRNAVAWVLNFWDTSGHATAPP